MKNANIKGVTVKVDYAGDGTDEGAKTFAEQNGLELVCPGHDNTANGLPQIGKSCLKDVEDINLVVYTLKGLGWPEELIECEYVY